MHTHLIPEQALSRWLPDQRWFAGKGAGIASLTIASDIELAPGTGGAPEMRHLILDVTQAREEGSSRDSYQVLAGLREDVPGRLEHAVIGPAADGRVAYDALHDQDLTRQLLSDMAAERARGPLRFHRTAAAPFGTELLGDERDDGSLVLTGEQSNTSLVFGEAAILKVFRRVAPGPNPDLEVTAALGALGSEHIAEPYGWIEARPGPRLTRGGDGGEATILAVLSRYLRAASDGWSLAATSVRDLYAQPDPDPAQAGGDFAGEASRLGAATAAVHRNLAEAFGWEELPPGTARELAEQMNARLTDALAAVPALREHAAVASEAYTRLARLREPVPVQRIHGDYHLGQVMRTQTGWVLLDFEGEPAVPLARRRARFSPLRDVAGMLRSLDYAARHQLLTSPDRVALERPARDWVLRNSGAFCAGYAEAGGIDPRQHATLLRALECDKAVYEVLYEARNRPSWLSIPLDSLAAMRAVPLGSPLAW